MSCTLLRALLFDVDGTLAETEELHRQAFNSAFAAAGLPWHWSPERYRALLSVAGGRERIAHFQTAYREECQSICLSEAAIAEIHRDKNRRFGELLASGALPLRPGVVRLAREAAAAGAAIGIVTTTSPENVTALLTALWPADAPPFATIVTAREAPRKKPDPQAYLVALHQTGLAPHEAVAIEDTTHGAAAATAAGIPVIISESEYGRADAYPGALAVVEHLGEPQQPARFLISPTGNGSGWVTWPLLTQWVKRAQHLDS
jgi:HAD superfamily hydrolase (TIGR01509 family)